MPAYAKSPTRFRNPDSRPKIVLACACQRCGGRLYAQEEQKSALPQDRIAAAGSRSDEVRRVEQPEFAVFEAKL